MTTFKILLQRKISASVLPKALAPLIYVVDDQDGVGELYALFLQASGYQVKAFTDRAKALEALKEERSKPALLITDYLGLSMPIDGFIQHCRAAHPRLRILMASGCSEPNMDFLQPMSDRFLQKPFTPDELQHEVEATLAA